MAALSKSGFGGKTPLALSFVLIVGGFLIHDQLLILTDNVAWHLQGARVLLGGGTLYRDFFETNPPLITYLNVPVVLLAGQFGLSLQRAFCLAVYALAGVSFGLSLRSLLESGVCNRATRWLGCCFVYLVTILPGPDFGEREHLLVLFASPYFLDFAGGLAGGGRGRTHSILCALFAAVGFALKPHFLVGLAAILAYCAFRFRKNALTMVPGAAIIFFVAAVYGLLVVVFHPEYWQTMLPFVMDYYVFESDFRRLLTVFALTGVPLILLAQLPSRSERSFQRVLLAVASVFSLIYFLQQKGFSYHLLPAMIFGYLGLAVALAEDIKLDRRRAMLAVVLLLPFLLGWPVLSAWKTATFQPAYQHSSLLNHVRDRYAGRPVLILTTHFSTPFPLAIYAGIEWASRFPSLSMLPVILERAGGEAAARFITGALAEDLGRYSPLAVIIDKETIRESRRGPTSLFAFLNQDSRFAAAFKDYHWVEETPRFLIFERGG